MMEMDRWASLGALLSLFLRAWEEESALVPSQYGWADVGALWQVRRSDQRFSILFLILLRYVELVGDTLV